MVSRCLMTMASRAREASGWRLWVSSTGRHWALRCAILTAAHAVTGHRVRLPGIYLGTITGSVAPRGVATGSASRQQQTT